MIALLPAAKETGATLIQYFNTDAPLYPETVTVKGSIVWSSAGGAGSPRRTRRNSETRTEYPERFRCRHRT